MPSVEIITLELTKNTPMTDSCSMVFIETPLFTRQVTTLLDDDSYAIMQQGLIEQPDKGDLIQGGGGIRKLRHALPGRGKSSGVRVIYYCGTLLVSKYIYY